MDFQLHCCIYPYTLCYPVNLFHIRMALTLLNPPFGGVRGLQSFTVCKLKISTAILE